MKNKLIIIFIFAILAVPYLALGAEIVNPLGEGTSTVTDLARKIADYLLLIGGPIATIIILYAGLLFMTSGGSEQKVKTAKATLTWAVVGLAILIINWGIASIIQEILKGKF